MKQKFFNNLKSVRWFSGKNEVWYDETGTAIPYKRTTKSERLAERKSKTIVMTALELNDRLAQFKKYLKDASEEVYRMVMKEAGMDKKTKGNFTWYNFDRSVKIEVNLSEPISFDEILIQAAKEKFNEFLEQNITAKTEFIKSLIMEAFQTRKGKLDAKRVINLTRYDAKINDPLFSEAVKLINKAIRRNRTKRYYKVFVRDDEGQYKTIELNFSNVKIPEDA